jgi:uncharacterized membrane protein YgdD (TMEM256/DUF423 family)
MRTKLIATGGILAAAGVALGALGAHWLKENISMTDLQNFETAIRYLMYHAFAILFMAAVSQHIGNRFFNLAFHAFWLGTLLFSGSIMLLATRELTGFYWPWLGPVTPFGGLLFIAGWILLVISGFKAAEENEDDY